MLGFIGLSGRWQQFVSELKRIWQNKKVCRNDYFGGDLDFQFNWFTFIFTVSAGHVMEASLGYYINPLVNVLLATVFLKERLSRSGMIACGLAAVGVIMLSVQLVRSLMLH